LFRLLLIALGLAQIIAARNTIGPDARSYLELARAILRHDWAMTANAYWSALYPWLLAAVLAIVKPSLRWEFPAAHALAFPILLACMAAFEFFWVSMLRLREQATIKLPTASPIPSWQMWTLGYSFFIWLTVGDLITAINPDLCMTAIALYSAGLLIRIALTADASRSLYIWLGICLGIGYLVKAILFPMAFVFLAMLIVLTLADHSFAGRKTHIALAFLIFVIVAAPQIVRLSLSKGRLTFSDTGKLAFAWYAYKLPLVNWHGYPPGSGTPAHPTRKLFDHPAVYEFNGPLRSSYPPWYDPSYWNEGLSPAFQFKTIAKHTLMQVAELCSTLLHPIAWVLGIVLIILGCNLRETWKGIGIGWYLIATSAVAFGLYSLTLIQSRYLVPWEILFWGAIIAGVRLRLKTARWYGGLTAGVALILLSSMARLIRGESIHGFHNDAHAEYATAEGLQSIGLQPGTRVAAIGFDNDAYWAYLDRLNIVAEINSGNTCLFWSEPPAIQTQIFQKFSQAGATVVVANTGGGVRTTSRAIPIDLAGCSRLSAEWRQLPGSPNHAFFLK
jgi:hypothetical protein